MSNELEISSWKDLMKRLPDMDEAALVAAINYEVSRYNRRAIIVRLHQRYAKLFIARQRQALLDGKTLLMPPPEQ